METAALKTFAREARRRLGEQVGAKLRLVLAPGSDARREQPGAVAKLEAEVAATSEARVVERVAYLWFNRFCALRFMDANGFTSPRAVSPADGDTRPELLADAVAGHLPADLLPATAQRVRDLIDGRALSRDPQGEAYRLLLTAACNAWHAAMPFLFERIGDESELLCPEDLLSADGVLVTMRRALTEEACQDVEAIGWLYQFYIADKKQEVLDALKRNVKITPENIPAATQLFTPHWIVRYLVENSLGRLWLFSRPHSRLAERMDYYIAPEEPETDFLRVGSPEELRICDPACGSGHMLTYAFDLLHAIYEEEGYDPAAIPGLILTHNLYGIEVDERAGALAAFALVMKAAMKRRRFLREPVQPNVTVLEEVRFRPDELERYMDAVGRDLFTADLRTTLTQFVEAKNFGSLIRPALGDSAEARRVLEARGLGLDLTLLPTHREVLRVLAQAEMLSPRYHVVVANPPYLSDKYYSEDLKGFLARKYKNSRFNLYSAFIVRLSEMVINKCFIGMVTLQSWMSGSKYTGLREYILAKSPPVTMAHLGTGGFDTIGGQVVSSTAFVLQEGRLLEQVGLYIDLTPVEGEAKMALAVRNTARGGRQELRYTCNGVIFSRIPESPFVYWIKESEIAAFERLDRLDKFVDFRQGMATTDNGRFLRQWHEVSIGVIDFGASSQADAVSHGHNWFPYNKGGGDRRWYGHNDYIINYEKGGKTLIDLVVSKYPKISDPEFVIKNRAFYFLPSVTYSALSGSAFAARISKTGFIFDTKGSCIFPRVGASREGVAALLNSCVAKQFLNLLAPTLDFNLSALSGVPYPYAVPAVAESLSAKARDVSEADWDAYETSWDFARHPLTDPAHRRDTLADSYAAWRASAQAATDGMRALEEENNRVFIDAYGLQDELTPDVPLHEITLTGNPHYRYGAERAAPDGEGLMLADTARELVSYAIGCLMGRYSLDRDRLVLADAGATAADYLALVPEPTLAPDADGILPITEGEWFADDAAAGVRRFLRAAFGEARFEDNLRWLEEALGKPLRRYLHKDFFADHVKRYRKRPIYWLFASPKGTFTALLYLHRYTPDHVGHVLNDYLRPMRAKLDAARAAAEEASGDATLTPAQRTARLKEADALRKQITELDDWERVELYPLAGRRLAIYLDDGVRANYPQFGAALRKVPGLEAADD